MGSDKEGREVVVLELLELLLEWLRLLLLLLRVLAEVGAGRGWSGAVAVVGDCRSWPGLLPDAEGSKSALL